MPLVIQRKNIWHDNKSIFMSDAISHPYQKRVRNELSVQRFCSNKEAAVHPPLSPQHMSDENFIVLGICAWQRSCDVHSLQLIRVIHQRLHIMASSAPRLSSQDSNLSGLFSLSKCSQWCTLTARLLARHTFTSLLSALRGGNSGACSMTAMGQWQGWKGQSAFFYKYARVC